MLRKLEKEIVDKLISDNIGDYLIVSPVKPKTSTQSRTNWGSSAVDIIISAQKWNIKCSCQESGAAITENSCPVCPHCGREIEYNWRAPGFNRKLIVSSKLKKELDEMYKDNNIRSRGCYGSGNFIVKYKNNNEDKNVQIVPYSKENILRTYYVREKLDCKAGIDMLRLTVGCVSRDDKLVLEEKYDCFTEIIPGKQIRAFKTTKAKGDQEISLFDAFHITRDNVESDENVCFEGAASMIDFMTANHDFASRTGFIHLLMNYKGNIPENSLFLLYMYLLSEYPVIELLVKMGYYGLIFGLFSKICDVYRRDSIKEEVDNLSCLLNQTTKGSAALSIPTYIGQFLNSKNADISEYMTWVAINEREPISKENFEKYVVSEAYLYLNYYNCLDKVPNIMKYGYTLAQASKYILSQFFSVNENIFCLSNTGYGLQRIAGIANLWSDYLQHCELMSVEAARFPKNLKSVHDDIMVAYNAIQNAIIDTKLSCIADLYSDYKTTSKYLDVVWPRCVTDFVNEGNNQHNCVAGYSSRVQGGDCRIFFIRKQDSIDKSYITAECTKNGLGQLFYRNNQPVTDYTEREYAKAICKFILGKPWEPDEKLVTKKLKEKTK